MKRIIGLALILVACNPPTAPTPNGNVTVIQNVGSGTNSPAIASDTCLPVDRVRIVAFPSSLAVGDSARIDVTPKDEFGNNRSDNCNEATGNHWDSDDSICSVGQANDFVSSVKGIKAGTCELTACVAGKCDSVKFSVI